MIRKIDDLENPRELIYQTQTNEDGTYLLYVPNPDNYDLVIEKDGYLTHTVEKVTAKIQEKATVKDIEIYAGNIVKYTTIGTTAQSVGGNGQGTTGSGNTGNSAIEQIIEQIEVEDLIALNDNYGVVITDANEDKYGMYDLNEDKVVDKKDRNILKANFNKKAVTETWVNASAYNFILPTNSTYTINSPYGNRLHPTKGVIKKHTGIDLGVTHHSEVLSIANGEVTFAGEQSGYGYCVEIKHIVNGVTIYSFYAHLSQIDVNVGDVVAQGQKIGLEGGAETDPGHGTSTGHHLHFEIRTASGSGNDVNPCDYINF